MKRSAKAVLLSALVFPGAGHVYLKRHLVGVILIVIAVAASYRLMADATHVAFAISDRMLSGDIPLDANSIDHLVTQQTQQVARSSSISTWILGLSWLIGMVDSYRVGTALEGAKTNSMQP